LVDVADPDKNDAFHSTSADVSVKLNYTCGSDRRVETMVRDFEIRGRARG